MRSLFLSLFKGVNPGGIERRKVVEMSPPRSPTGNALTSSLKLRRSSTQGPESLALKDKKEIGSEDSWAIH